MTTIPEHLAKYDWYASHLAWMRELGYEPEPEHDPGEAASKRADFSGMYLPGVDLSGADLRGAAFSGVYLGGADLSGADLSGANLRGADLSGARFSGADFSGADLRGANLRGADLRDASGLPDAPVVPNIDAAILAAIKQGGCLNMTLWHSCETTHCRAGWAVHLAGDAGYALEKQYGPQVAGTLIYLASRSGRNAPNFFATNAEALADLRECAGVSH